MPRLTQPTLARRLCLVSPALAIALCARHLRALHARFGGLDGVDLDDPLAVARALFARELPDPLVRALEEIERLATAIGREAILEGARGRVADFEALAGRSPVDLAARVVIRALAKTAEGESARKIVRRARVRVERYFSPRASYEVVATPGLAQGDDALVEAARAVHGEERLVAAWTVLHGDVVYGAFVHEGLPERISRRDHRAIVRRTWRPFACDCVRWDRAKMRAGFQLARPALLPEWKAAFAALAPLAARPAFSLRLPYEKGVDWYDAKALPAAVRGVSVVGCELDDGSRYSVRSPNALADLHERLAGGGYLVRATFRFEMTSGEKTDATIELPNKLTIADARFEDVVREAIDALGLTKPGALADDLASLAPFEHAAWRWVEVVSAEGFARGVALKLFTKSTATRRAADVEHRSYGSSLMVHDLGGEESGTKYALGEDLSVRAYDIPAEATVRWRLDTTRFAENLAARLHVSRAMRLKRAPPDGLLPIGALAIGAANACIFQLMRVVREAEAGDVREQLRVACGAAHAVVLVGKGRSVGKGIAQVEVDAARLFGEGELADVVAQIAEALGVEDEIALWRFGTEGKPLVIHVGRGEAWFGKVRLKITANQFAMLAGLARTPGELVSAAELGGRISPNAGIVDQIVRKTRVGWEEKIAKSFTDAKVEMPQGLPAKLIEVDKARGCYRLGVGVVVLA